MIELYFLIFYIPRKVRPLAQARNQSVWAWSLRAIGAWVGVEIFISVIFSLIIPFNGKMDIFLFAIYLSALFPAYLAANVVINKLRNLPTANQNNTPWQ